MAAFQTGRQADTMCAVVRPGFRPVPFRRSGQTELQAGGVDPRRAVEDFKGSQKFDIETGALVKFLENLGFVVVVGPRNGTSLGCGG